MTDKPQYPDTLELAMLAIQVELTNPIKDTKNDFFKSKYATLPEIRNLVTPILAKQGLYITQFVHGELLRTFITHAPTTKSLYADTNLMMDKATPQGQGSAITYARRYALCAMLNIAADEDDDGNSASVEPKAKNNALKNDPAVKQDMKELGYDAEKEADRMSGELDLIMDESGLNAWFKKNKRYIDTLPTEMKDETRKKYAMVKAELNNVTKNGGII